MAKSIIQKRTDPLNRECFLCREEAERNEYYGELRHTGLHKHHSYMAGSDASEKRQSTMGCGAMCVKNGTTNTARKLHMITKKWTSTSKRWLREPLRRNTAMSCG